MSDSANYRIEFFVTLNDDWAELLTTSEYSKVEYWVDRMKYLGYKVRVYKCPINWVLLEEEV